MAIPKNFLCAKSGITMAFSCDTAFRVLALVYMLQIFILLLWKFFGENQ